MIPPLLVASVLFACSGPAEPVHLEPQEGELVLDGYVENWTLGEDYYVFIGTPDVDPGGTATFPHEFTSSQISPDGTFTLYLSKPAADPQPGGVCPEGSAELSRSFHYLAVTGKPEPGEEFRDLAYLRPDLPEGRLLFLTWLEGLDRCVESGTARGWHAFVRTGPDAEGSVQDVHLGHGIGFELSL